VGPPLKAVATDLDGTLYDGVLGEDGAANLIVTPGHIQLQRKLLELRERGVILAIISRNDPRDIEMLFACREDFAVRLTDFSVIDAGWDTKGAALKRIASRIGIDTSAVAFIDDNPGDLVDVAMSCAAPTVHATTNAAQTVAALGHVAGAFRWRKTAEDSMRAEDLRQSVARDTLRDAADTEDDYLRSLRVRLEYHVGAAGHVARAADLVSKTNQFNLSLRRMPEAQIARRLGQHRQNVVTIGLADRLSDSGIVGVVIGELVDDTLIIEELCISCRALGRRLEDDIVTQALLLMAEGRPPTALSFDVRDGPRNAPAREWLVRYAHARPGDWNSASLLAYDAVTEKSLSTALQVVVIR